MKEIFEKKCIPEPNTGCWIWIGAMKSHGYGHFRYKNTDYAHRASYEIYKCAPTEGMEIDHLCSNKWCVNPDHLEEVTHAENGIRHQLRTKKVCINGHSLEDKSNLIVLVERKNQRRCKICHRQRMKKYKSILRELQ